MEILDETKICHVNKRGQFVTFFHIPDGSSRFVCGRNGWRNCEVARTTGTSISISNERHTISITGENEESVEKAFCKIKDLIYKWVHWNKKSNYFICIPLFNEEIQRAFEKFKDQILTQLPQRLTEELFVKPKKMHLNIASLYLDNEEVAKAIQGFEKLKTEVIPHFFPQNKLHTFDIIGIDTEFTRKIAGKVSLRDKSLNQNLITFIKEVRNINYKFLSPCKWHTPDLSVKLMNSYSKEGNIIDRNNIEVIQKTFGEYFFGNILFEEIRLCKAGSDVNDCYETVSVLKL